MKKITRLLATVALLFGVVGGVTSVKAGKTIGTEYTSVEQLNGKYFAIVNKTDRKAICNKKASNDYDLQYLSYAEAFSSDVTAYLFKIEQINDPDDAAANGKYLIRPVKEDGSTYTFYGWATPYFQTNMTGTGVCFFFDLNFANHKRGADADNTGTWDIQYDPVNEGWTLKNVGTGKYYNDPTKDAMSETPAYFTFCEVVNSPDTPQTKNPILLLKGGAINTTDFDITPISPSTLATDNLYAATFTSKDNTKNAFQYKDLDVSTYEKIVIKYSIEDNSEWRICLPDNSIPALPTGTNKTYEINLSNISTYADFTIFSSFQNHTVGSSITISEVYYVESSDPYASERAELQAAIDLGNAQNSFAKTTASWKALQDAITAATAELTKTDATAESLTAAKEAITNAIAGFKLQDGYTFLTTDMYKRWNDNYNPTTSESTGCYYVLNESVDKVYGDGDNVYYLNFADISDFDKLYVLVKAGQARVQMNRETDNGTTHIAYRGDAVSVVDFATEKQEGGVLEGFDFVHLNAIKDNWGKVTVSDMLLYRTITVGDAGYATFGSLYKNAKPNGVTAYAAVYNSDKNKMDLTPVTSVPAGKGVIIEADEAGSYAPTFDVTVSEIDDIENELKVSNGTVVGDGSTIYVLADDVNGVGFYLLEEGNKVPAGKVYYKSTSNDARQFIGFDEGATAIKTVKGAEAENAIYNLAGQRLTKAQKGLNIVNGKVVLVK